MDNFTITTFLSNNKNVFTWCSIAIGLPSTLLYCAEIWTILWHKPFHNSFYTLFVLRASTVNCYINLNKESHKCHIMWVIHREFFPQDLIYTFATYFFLRLPILFIEWFMSLELPNWTYSFFTCFGCYTFVSDSLAMAFIL